MKGEKKMKSMEELKQELEGKDYATQVKEIKRFIQEVESENVAMEECPQGVNLKTLRIIKDNVLKEAKIQIKLFKKHPLYKTVKEAKKLLKETKKLDKKTKVSNE